MKQKKNIRGHVKTVAVCAILAVIGFVLDRFVGISIPLFGVTSLMINVSYIPIFLAGILYGPVWGALVGGVQDILCMILVPLGAPIWGITATTMLAGAMAGVFGRFILKIKAENRGELLVPVAKDSPKNKFYYIFASFAVLLYGLEIFTSATSITVGETVHDLSMWDILTRSSAYKNAFLEITSLYNPENLPEVFYAWSGLADTFGMISALFVLALPLLILAVFFSHKRKNVLAIISILASFVFSGVAVVSLMLQIPKSLKDLPVEIRFGLAPFIALTICALAIIFVLIETDPLKFKISAFCAITAITTSVLNSFWLSLAMSSVGFVAYLLPRLATAVLLTTPLYSFLLYYLLVKAKWLKKMV
ncbi:MAG: ECF transporter S component [Clostridia bacterium]|nr:ECF transporter S component [Clostridia bacterium]